MFNTKKIVIISFLLANVIKTIFGSDTTQRSSWADLVKRANTSDRIAKTIARYEKAETIYATAKSSPTSVADREKIDSIAFSPKK